MMVFRAVDGGKVMDAEILPFAFSLVPPKIDAPPELVYELSFVESNRYLCLGVRIER